MAAQTESGTGRDVLSDVLAVAREHLDLSDASVAVLARDDALQLRLVEDLELDSIQLLTLAVELENHFEVTLDEFEPGAQESDDESTEAVELETLGQLVRLIEGKVQALASR